MNVAIIPARGGSKRIPRKNINLFCGKPIISYPIAAALACKTIDRVVVSTDDNEIAAVATEYGAQVPFVRDPSLADDHVGTTAVIRATLEQLNEHGWNINSCACLYATAPFITAQRIDDAFAMLEAAHADFVFTANQFSFPVQRALLEIPSGGVRPYLPEMISKRSQDLAHTFHDAGQLYVARAETWLDNTKKVFSENARMLKLPSHMVQDIDTPEDWKRAEVMFRVLQEMGEC